jgi:hypothetical protein
MVHPNGTIFMLVLSGQWGFKHGDALLRADLVGWQHGKR